jgi:RimJ/RimL family protein N-acetyltransferase
MNSFSLSSANIGPTLVTERLILRPTELADFDGFAQMASEPETMRFIGGAGPRHAAWRAMATFAGSWTLLGFSMFSVLRRDTGEWIGRIGPWQPGGDDGGWPGREVGWGLKASAMGQGFAAEAATATIDWAFDHLGWNEIIHCIDKANASSIRLATRLGSTLKRTGVSLPAPLDSIMVDIYGQSRAEWRSR